MAEETLFVEWQIPQNEIGSITQVIRKNYTRTEAIEKMAKAMYKAVWGKMRYSKFDKERFCKLAEPTLNALLEGK